MLTCRVASIAIALVIAVVVGGGSRGGGVDASRCDTRAGHSDFTKHGITRIDTHCVCGDASKNVCLGGMCDTLKSTVGNLDGHKYDVGYDLHCASCTCEPVSHQQREHMQFYTWTEDQLYYHLHISKTGGTTFLHFLEHMANHARAPENLTMCQTEKHPFSHPPFFADPKALRKSDCNVVSAEGRMTNVERQFDYRPVNLLVFLRHPILRTLSQWKHDRTYELNHMRERWNSHSDYTRNLSSLQDYYNSVPESDIHPRYSDWQLYLLMSQHLHYPKALSSFAFIGITEFYHTSECLFFFTFQMSKFFHNCQNLQVKVYNAACKDSTNCKFHNTGSEEEEAARTGVSKDPHQRLQAQLDSIDSELYDSIERHTQKDMELYSFALDLFWKRVNVMEQVTGRTFSDMPAKYRSSPRTGF
eukprot:m.224876 g.224876  ORF g.224876 m.224876 type:complete len:416 (+) comp15154_c0_seq1:212-1459(+)